MASLPTLSVDISNHVKTITGYLEARNLPQPSFDATSPSGLPADPIVQHARFALIEAASTMLNLAIGPDDLMRWGVVTPKYDLMVLHFLAHYKIFDLVPLEGSISYVDLSELSGLPQPRLHRILRHAFTNHYFYLPEPGRIAHTSNSAFLHNNPGAQAWLLHNVDEVEPWYSVNGVDATLKWGDSTDPKETGPNLTATPNTAQTFFERLESDNDGQWGAVSGEGWRVKRFGDAMTYMTASGTHRASHLHAGFDWDSLGKATVVDIGGSVGHVSLEIASQHPLLSFIVQDRPDLEDQFHKNTPPEQKDRFSFHPHDFFTPQPIQGADVYFMRGTLHNWSDPMVIKIIRNIVPAMSVNKSRIITMDIVIEGGDVNNAPTTTTTVAARSDDSAKERHAAAAPPPPPGLGPIGPITQLNSSLDLQMMVVFNSCERTREEWARVFRQADERLVMRACNQPVGSGGAIMEFILVENGQGY